MRTGFEWWFSGCGMGITLADFQTVGKNPNISIRLKGPARIRALRDKFCIAVAPILFVPGQVRF